MADESSTTLHLTPVPANTYNPVCSVDMAPGTPVAQSTTVPGEVVPAAAGSANTAKVIGLVSKFGAVAGKRAFVQFLGPITLTTEEWDAIAGTSGGLAEGVAYYLSATAGQLTSNKPVASGTFDIYAIIGLTPTDAFIQVTYPTAANS
jgi:hypothetical protein